MLNLFTSVNKSITEKIPLIYFLISAAKRSKENKCY